VTGDEVAGLLGLAPLAGEGGQWAQTWRDEHSSAIYLLLQPEDFSAFHRLSGLEVYHFYGGDPAELWLLEPHGSWRLATLGLDLRAGQRPVCVVTAGTWQASRTTGAWTLLGTTMVPPFSEAGFELAEPGELLARYPARAAEIAALTRTTPS
jgi:uncharacterized protein